MQIPRGRDPPKQKTRLSDSERRNKPFRGTTLFRRQSRPFSGHARCPSSVTGSPVRVYSSPREFQAAAPGRAGPLPPAVLHLPTALCAACSAPCPLHSVCSMRLFHDSTSAPRCQVVGTHKNPPPARRLSRRFCTSPPSAGGQERTQPRWDAGPIPARPRPGSHLDPEHDPSP